MRHLVFAAVAVGLIVWHRQQPDIAIYALLVLSGAGLRAIFDLTWREK